MRFHQPADSARETGGAPDVEQLMAEPRWQQLMDALPDAFILLDHAGQVRFLNSAAESVTELLRSEVLGRPLGELVSRSGLDLAALLPVFADGARSSRFLAEGADGRAYVISARSVRDWHGNVNCLLVTIRERDDPLQRVDAQGVATLPRSQSERSDDRFPTDEGMVLCSSTRVLVERGLRAVRLGARLLLLGESGVGKTEFARLLHRRSAGGAQPFVHVNCGSIPESLFESEMFGYERGSFTGALSKGKRGLVEAADGGTLFLDEVGEIPLTSQAKMLQFLEEGGVQRVGSTQMRPLRVQILTATNRDLGAMVAEGKFRADLFYRLKVVTLRLPPLRERADALEPLIDRFLAAANRRRSVPLRLDRVCRQMLRAHDYPGNVRELQNLIEHLSVVCEGTARAGDLSEALEQVSGPGNAAPRHASAEARSPPPGEPLHEAVRRYESRLVREAIVRAGSKRKAAELLGVDIATIVRKSR